MAKMTAAHKQQAAALGLTEAQIAECEAAGIDWSKLFAIIQQLIPLILSLFVKTPPPNPPPAQK